MVFLSLKIDFVFANIAYTDEMQRSVAFRLDLHCLQKYPLFMGFQSSPLTFLTATTKQTT